MHRCRCIATAVCAATSIGVLTFGLTAAFRPWSGGEVDNLISFSPVIFARGVMLLFIAAIVYEVLPEKKAVTWDRAQTLAAGSSVQQATWKDQAVEERGSSCPLRF